MDPARRVARFTLTGQLEEALKRDIASGLLVPGQPLRVSEIADRFGVSATPTREALQRLTAQGLVVVDAKHTSRVAEVSVPDLEEVYWLRQMLEPVALRLALVRADERWRTSVKNAIDELQSVSPDQSDGSEFDAAEWSHAHWTFHHTLFSGAQSPQLERILTNLYHHSERYRMLVRGVVAPAAMGDEHEEIATRILGGDEEGAVAALTGHFNGTVALLKGTALPTGGERVLGRGA